MNSVLRTVWRVLTFQATREELALLDGRHLAFGLVFAWLAGMGRYWDDPRAEFLQQLGIGSVVYVFVLSGLLWVLGTPLRLPRWRYRDVLTFVTLTSPPALLYALPVERWFGVRTAIDLNVGFLAVVASWRVALWVFFLVRFARLGAFATTVVALLPLTAIVLLLSVLNLQHAVFEIMGGMRDPTPHDGAYVVVLGLTGLSGLMILPLLGAYASIVGRARTAAAAALPHRR